MTQGRDVKAHELEATLALLSESCGVGIWHIDEQGRTVYMNEAMRRLVQLSDDEELSRVRVEHFLTPESVQRFRAERELRRAGLPSTYEVEGVGRRGARIHALISGSPLVDEHNRLCGQVATVVDITEMKRAQAAEAAAKERLDSLFRASIDAIGVSLHGKHVMVNPAYLQMFGYEHEDQLVNRPILDLIAPTERAAVAAHVRLRSQGRNQVARYFSRGLRQSGEEFPMEVSVSYYEHAGELHTVVILRDVTEKLRLEEQLRQSQKMDALGRMAGGVAHDFNNLLMVIMGASELIMERPDDAALVRSNAELIHATGQRAAALTRQLLALSRRQVVAPKVVDINGVIEETTDMLRRLLGANVSLAVVPDPTLAPARVDPTQLAQVIMNLCLNARDAMPEGGRITIRTGNAEIARGQPRETMELPPGRYVRIAVQDTGRGMDRSTLEQLFEPFFTTKPLGKGTGLGLATVYGIVKQSGGHVSVSSTPGRGSTFVVSLPAVDAPLSAAAHPAAPSLFTKGCTVLLVEDDHGVRRLLSHSLRAQGYELREAASGEEALRLFSSAPSGVDLVLTDVMMPGMSGVDLALSLERLCPTLPVLFMSGYAAVDTVRQLTPRAHWSFIDKPFNLHDLSARIQQLRAAVARR